MLWFESNDMGRLPLLGGLDNMVEQNSAALVTPPRDFMPKAEEAESGKA